MQGANNRGVRRGVEGGNNTERRVRPRIVNNAQEQQAGVIIAQARQNLNAPDRFIATNLVPLLALTSNNAINSSSRREAADIVKYSLQNDCGPLLLKAIDTPGVGDGIRVLANRMLEAEFTDLIIDIEENNLPAEILYGLAYGNRRMPALNLLLQVVISHHTTDANKESAKQLISPFLSSLISESQINISDVIQEYNPAQLVGVLHDVASQAPETIGGQDNIHKARQLIGLLTGIQTAGGFAPPA